MSASIGGSGTSAATGTGSERAPQPMSPGPAPSLYDNPGVQSPPDEPEILVPTRRPGGGIHFVALKR
jgi:hypothetical protein